jgi:short-subunit dehydrogenase
MTSSNRPFAIVTGASTGIGLELARCCAAHDLKVGRDEKDDPVEVVRAGFEAMMRGEGDIVTGWKNKLQAAIANVTPAAVLAEQHRKLAEPGSGRRPQHHERTR